MAHPRGVSFPCSWFFPSAHREGNPCWDRALSEQEEKESVWNWVLWPMEGPQTPTPQRGKLCPRNREFYAGGSSQEVTKQETLVGEGVNRSVMSNSLWPHQLWPTRLLCPWGFSRQEYWSGWPCPPPGGRPNPGIEFGSPRLQADSLPSEPPGKPFVRKPPLKRNGSVLRGAGPLSSSWVLIETLGPEGAARRYGGAGNWAAGAPWRCCGLMSPCIQLSGKRAFPHESSFIQ